MDPEKSQKSVYQASMIWLTGRNQRINETKCSMKQNVKFRTILTKQTKGQVTQNFCSVDGSHFACAGIRLSGYWGTRAIRFCVHQNESLIA